MVFFFEALSNQREITLAIFFMLILTGSPIAEENDLRFEHIGREQGLTASSVLSIIQDHQGFMWFGTKDGLFRFDGYSVTAYRHDPLDSTSLGNNHVFAVLEDRNGKLWLGTAGGGLNHFDRTTERFRRYKHQPDNPNSLSADVVSALYEDRSGMLWVGTWNGLNAFDIETGTITQFMHHSGNATSMNPHWIRTICEDSLGAIWVGTDGGISRLNPQTGKFTHFVEDASKPHSLSSNAVNSIIRDRAGTLWVGSWGGLDRFDYASQHFTNFQLSGRVSAIREDRTGALWIGTVNHLLRFNSPTGQFVRFFHDPTNPYSLSSNTIQAIYEDRTCALWIGTNNGVNRLDSGQFRFKQIVHKPEDENSLSQQRVTAIHEGRSGAIWIATAKLTQGGREIGLDKFDSNTGSIKRLFANLRSDDIRRYLFINYIHEARSGVLWLGTGAGLVRYDPNTEQFTRFVHNPHDPHSLSGNNIWRIYEDQAGTIWVAVHKDGPSGIDRFDRVREKFSRIDFLSQINSGESRRNGVHSIFEGESGRLWFATMGDGIFLLKPNSEEFIQFTHDPHNPNSLSHGWVSTVLEDRTGMVWAAPWHGGLNKLNPETGRVTVYTEKNGLSSNHIKSIVEDDHGRLWLTTLNGLSRFDPRSETFRNFDDTDGLLNTEFNMWNVSFRSGTGELYFADGKGIDFVHPDSIRDNPHIPPVVFTKFIRYNSDEASGQAIVEKGVTEKRRFDFSYKDHTLTFAFAALNYRAPHKNQYAYKLEGFLNEWIQLGNKHEVTLTNLNPGEYTLRAKGSNNDGVWNERGASLVITISAPWWQTGWAYVLYVVLIGLALYGVRHFELRRAALRNALEKKDFEAQKLQEVDRLKSRFFADISHEFRTPLTLILGPFEKIMSVIKDRERREDLRAMQRNAHRLERLVDQLLDLSRIEARRMPLLSHAQDIVQNIREWVASFVSLAENRGIMLNLHFPEQPIAVYFDAEKLEKVIYNLLGNAFKFTPEGGMVIVDFGFRNADFRTKQEDDSAIRNPKSEIDKGKRFVQLTVKDSGIGIAPEHLPHVFDRFYRASEALSGEQDGTGVGLALAKEFVELHHGEILVESEPGKGSTFIVLLPLGCEHLSDEEIVEYGAEGQGSEPLRQPLEMMLAETDFASDAPSTSAKTGRPLVLIVEDNADMCRYLRSCLKPDFEIVEAEHGERGFGIACKIAPDLIVSDVMMPVMDGFALCEKLKTDPRTSHIPVILLTARAGQEDRLEGLENGADDYLTKPFDARELTIRVKNLIAQRRQLHARFRREILIEPSEITATSMDEAFLKKVVAAVETHIDDPEFATENLAKASGVSRRHLNRKLRALTGQSVREFIRTVRLKRAAQLLQQDAATVTEVVYQVGFNNPSHFAKVFREQFGVAPSAFSGSNNRRN